MSIRKKIMQMSDNQFYQFALNVMRTKEFKDARIYGGPKYLPEPEQEELVEIYKNAGLKEVSNEIDLVEAFDVTSIRAQRMGM